MTERIIKIKKPTIAITIFSFKDINFGNSTVPAIEVEDDSSSVSDSSSKDELILLEPFFLPFLLPKNEPIDLSLNPIFASESVPMLLLLILLGLVGTVVVLPPSFPIAERPLSAASKTPVSFNLSVAFFNPGFLSITFPALLRTSFPNFVSASLSTRAPPFPPVK